MSDSISYIKIKSFDHLFAPTIGNLTLESFDFTPSADAKKYSTHLRFGGKVQVVVKVSGTMQAKFRLISKQWYKRSGRGYKLVDDAEEAFKRLVEIAIETFRMTSANIPVSFPDGQEFVTIESRGKSLMYSIYPWFCLRG